MFNFLRRKKRVNQEMLAKNRFGRSFSQLKPDQQQELLLDIETAFLSGDNGVGVTASILGGEAYPPGRSGNEQRPEGNGIGKPQGGETIRRVPPHGGQETKGGVKHLPLDRKG